MTHTENSSDKATPLTKDVVAAIQKEATSQAIKWALGALIFILGLAALGWGFYLREMVPIWVGGLPQEAMILVDGNCPKYWTRVEKADGRYIRLRSDRISPVGGADELKLVKENIPTLAISTTQNFGLGENHSLWGSSGTLGEGKIYSLNQAPSGYGGVANYPLRSLFVGTNNPQSIKVEPLYFGLTLCKR